MILLDRKFLILAFCSIGCSIHLFHVVNEFLKFPVRTDIIYDYPKTMIVPEIDIILYNMDLLNLTELQLVQPQKMMHICTNLMKVKNLPVNLDENFKANCAKMLKSYYENSFFVGKMLTVGDVESLNIESLIPKNKLTHFIRNDLCSIKRYFNAIHTIIRVSCRDNSRQIETALVRNIVADNRFCIQHKINHRFGVRFAHPNSSINTETLNYIEVEREAGESAFTMLRYRETIIESSEWPYQTNCRHYQKEKIYSRCLREKISHSYPGIVSLHDILEVGQFPSNLKFDDLKSSYNATISRMQSECTEQVEQPQCIEKAYQTKGKTLREKGSRIGLFCLENQYDFNIILKTYPQSTLTELLIYISSILGIWFGISIYGKMIDGFIFPAMPQPIVRKVNVVPTVEETDNQ